MMCENALKTRLDDLGTAPYGSTFLQTVWQCFNLIDTTPTPSLPVVVTTHNFGRDKGEIGRARIMCETAKKERVNAAGVIEVFGDATGEVVECRDFRTPKDHQVPVSLRTQNFGQDKAVVRVSQLVCERAEKIPTFGPNRP